MQSNTSLSADGFRDIVYSGKYTFALDANRTGKFRLTPSKEWVARDCDRYVAWAPLLGITTDADLEARLTAMAPRSREIFHAFGSQPGADLWDSETTMLFLLVLISSAPHALTVADLTATGWEQGFAEQTLSTAQRITPRAHVE